MTTPLPHPMFPGRTHDELARDAVVRAMRTHLLTRLEQVARTRYDAEWRPRWEQELGRPLADRREIHARMVREMPVRFQVSTQRSVQEYMQLAVAESVERQLPALVERARRLERGLGTLELDPSLAIPDYQARVDIHCQPGGYDADHGDGDVAAGAMYDRTVSLYLSIGGGLNDYMGTACAAFVRERWPEIAPRRILEMGCGTGNALLPYARAWPEAEVHGIDIGAALLRYAHARAEGLGVKVHLTQQNAEATKFPDGSFDLIVSHILAHEVPPKAWIAINREARRLLRPGGRVVHADALVYGELAPYTQYSFAKETKYNNEPYWCPYRERDPRQALLEAGFAPEQVLRDFADPAVRTQVADLRRAMDEGRLGDAEAISRRPLGLAPRWAFTIGLR